MEKIDEAKTQISQGKERLVVEEKKLKQDLSKIDQEIKDIEEKISGLEKERNQLCPNVEKGLLNKYERILRAKVGLALVPISGEFCGGCNQVMPPQVINEVRLKERIVVCESCARILYWPQ